MSMDKFSIEELQRRIDQKGDPIAQKRLNEKLNKAEKGRISDLPEIAEPRKSEALKKPTRANQMRQQMDKLNPGAAKIAGANTPNIDVDDFDDILDQAAKEAGLNDKQYAKFIDSKGGRYAKGATEDLDRPGAIEEIKKYMSEKGFTDYPDAATKMNPEIDGMKQLKSGKAMKIAAELEPDEAMKATIAKMTPGGKLKRFGKAALKGAAALGAIGTGMEAIDYVKEAADEELERKDEAAMYKASEDQYAKTKAKILKDKTGESLKNIKSLQASTKKNTPKVKSAPKTIPTPKGKSDEQKTKDYMGYMKAQLGTDYEDDAPKAKSSDMGAQKGKKQAGVSDFGRAVEKAMDKNIKSEVKSGKYKDLKWKD